MTRTYVRIMTAVFVALFASIAMYTPAAATGDPCNHVSNYNNQSNDTDNNRININFTSGDLTVVVTAKPGYELHGMLQVDYTGSSGTDVNVPVTGLTTVTYDAPGSNDIESIHVQVRRVCAPTATPTPSPTVVPTVTPTVQPTVTPTVTPTVEPTPQPTVTPEPTVEPTPEPTPVDEGSTDEATGYYPGVVCRTSEYLATATYGIQPAGGDISTVTSELRGVLREDGGLEVALPWAPMPRTLVDYCNVPAKQTQTTPPSFVPSVGGEPQRVTELPSGETVIITAIPPRTGTAGISVADLGASALVLAGLALLLAIGGRYIVGHWR